MQPESLYYNESTKIKIRVAQFNFEYDIKKKKNEDYGIQPIQLSYNQVIILTHF